MSERFKFNRMELAGSFGDLGTLLPIAIAMILVNGMNPIGLFFSIGLFYLLSGVYFGVTVPVQPMKVIGAYAIATSMSVPQILSSSLLMGVFLLIIGLTGAIDLIRKYTPVAVIRGVQLSTGMLLVAGGVKFIIGTSTLQTIHNTVEPYLAIQQIGPLPIGILIGTVGGLVTLLLLNNKKVPAGLAIILFGVMISLILGRNIGLKYIEIGFNWPKILPFPLPGVPDLSFALIVLVLPQLPMTLGNAVIAYADLSKEYFGEKASRVTAGKACLSMAIANFFSFLLGGMPLCHGAGGLAAHYRFGARTAGSNVMIGIIFMVLAILFGNQIVTVLNLLPFSILGVLLVFAGIQLSLTIIGLDNRKDYFIVLMILGITLAANLAAAFITGIIIAHLLKWKKLTI
ncbi:MAG: putative sulfate/molybdate transporter [Desulfobacterales bacterium]|nr:putative sulfate/molybdate transporter [Desulfobacterales bacterium]